MVGIEVSRPRVAFMLGASVLLYAAAGILWAQKGLEENMLVACNPVYENGALLGFFRLVSHYGMGVLAVSYSVLVLFTSGGEKPYENSKLFLFVIFSFAMGSIAADLMKEVIGRARPVEVMGGSLMVTALSKTSSFPSGHAAKSMGLALPFMFLASYRSRTTRVFSVFALTVAVLVCCSRVALQKHFPSDILGGAATVLLFPAVAAWVANRMYARRKIEELGLDRFNRRLAGVFVLLSVLLVMI